MSPERPFDPYRLDRRLMKAAAKETRRMVAAGLPAYREKLEGDFASFVGRRFCVLTGSGREALSLAAAALRPGGGTAGFPDITHPSLAEAAEPPRWRRLPLDIDPRTLNLSETALRRAAPRLDLLILPHMFATPAPIEAAMRLSRRHGFGVIEDISQILGAGKERCGALGDICVLSLSPYKPVSSPLCRAGALLCDSPEIFSRLLALRPSPPKPQALPFLSLKLGRLASTLKSSRAANAVYTKAFSGIPGLIPGGISPETQEFPLMVPRKAQAEELFRKAGVPLERVYRPLRMEKGLPGRLPAADAYWRSAIHLPSWPLMTRAECLRAAALVKEHLEKR